MYSNANEMLFSGYRCLFGRKLYNRKSTLFILAAKHDRGKQ